ncbi:imidazole glycerol phosphate synthase subunit HisH [Paracoccus suum]|uniref:Imidazole glycerol phosphate synthase subunit HisH n=1 Tax=Paracoccus suum TaxID=2259340 RepID=A0A344PH08_9RHOB|nr:imidazole glycerol phosphate synthase subunit HisH [Paracoccus suum]AXC48663.1 imidazole glycerol phosphate synthase subunit HisH [Paracoccus suum]
MRLALVDYDSGNLHSAAKAFQRMAGPGDQVIVTADPAEVAGADRIVLPGDGAFPACRAALDAAPGMAEALADAVLTRGVPFMGICVGMQLLASTGHEYRTTPGLGWVPGEVVRIEPGPGLKVPHMGWNALQVGRPHPVLAGIRAGDHAYFVHSWRFAVASSAHLFAEVDHGGPVAAVVGRDNIVGLQFHPEKSQATGLRMIENFLRWKP